jgi:hypothetical protein
MRALNFVDALERIVAEMKVRELITLLQPWLVPAGNAQVQPAQREQFTRLVFESHSGYERLLQADGTRNVLNALNAGEIYEPGRMAMMINTVSAASTAQNIWSNSTVFVQFYAFLALLRSLETMRQTSNKFLKKEKIGTVPNDEGILEIELIDYDGAGIEPKRLELLVQTLIDLHTNLAMLHNVEGDSFRFQYFDSGSSLLLGLKAAKPIIDELNTILTQWWEKIRFRHFDTFDKKVEAVAKGLTISHSIDAAINSKVIDEETGRNLKRRILADVNELIGIGASLPLKTEASVDESKLLAGMKSTKLLESGTQDERRQG